MTLDICMRGHPVIGADLTKPTATAFTHLTGELGTSSPEADRVAALAAAAWARRPAGSSAIYPIPAGFKLSVVIPVYNEGAVDPRAGPPGAGRADPQGNHPRR